MRRPPVSRGARPVSSGGAPLSAFSDRLRRYEDERYRRIAEAASPVAPYPAGFRAEDVLGLSAAHGFLPLAEAAEAMSVPEAEVVEMVRRGLLESAGDLVRPALVSVLAVREVS